MSNSQTQTPKHPDNYANPTHNPHMGSRVSSVYQSGHLHPCSEHSVTSQVTTPSVMPQIYPYLSILCSTTRLHAEMTANPVSRIPSSLDIVAH